MATTSATTYEAIIVEKAEGIGTITLNRPQHLNAMNMQMLGELDDALTDFEGDPEVQVIVLAGAGRAFCAGRDLKEIGTDTHKTGISVWARFETINKPTIASVHGYCLAGALSMILCCDLVVATDTAIIGDVHAKHGIIHGGGATQRLREIIGTRKAKEMLFTCAPLSSVDAERFGLVNKVVPAEELRSATVALARTIIANSQETIRTAKYVMNQGMKYGAGVGLELEQREYLKHRELHTADIKTRTDTFFANKHTVVEQPA